MTRCSDLSATLQKGRPRSAIIAPSGPSLANTTHAGAKLRTNNNPRVKQRIPTKPVKLAERGEASLRSTACLWIILLGQDFKLGTGIHKSKEYPSKLARELPALGTLPENMPLPLDNQIGGVFRDTTAEISLKGPVASWLYLGDEWELAAEYCINSRQQFQPFLLHDLKIVRLVTATLVVVQEPPPAF